MDLALFAAETPAGVAEIAERQGIPRPFLHQILLGLKNRGMVTSKRGRHGGYMLAMPAGGISVAAVVQATQGSLLALPENLGGARNSVDAAICDVWDMIRSGVDEDLESVSIRDLCRRAGEKKKAADYAI